MTQFYMINRLIKRSTILVNYTILFTFAIFVVSCSGMKSIRSGQLSSYNNKNNATKKTEKIENQDNAKHNDIEAFEKKIIAKGKKEINSKETNNENNDINSAPLSSINQQLSKLENNQKENDSKFEKINEKLNQLAESISKITNDLDKIYDNQAIVPTSGNNHNIKANKQVKLSSEEENNSINENEIKSDQSETNNKSKLNKIASDETFIKSNDNEKKVIRRPRNTIASERVRPQTKKQTNDNNEINAIVPSDKTKNGINEFKKGNYSEAIRNLLEAKNSETSKKNLSEIAYYLGESYFNNGDFNNAITNYSNVIRNNNSGFVAESQLKLAESNLRIGKVSEAKLAYQKLITSYPESQFVPLARKMLQQL